MNELEIVKQVVDKTQSELILFLIIIVIALILVLLPLYAIISKDRKSKQELENIRQDKYIVREAQIIEVIKENSSVIAGLKATLEGNGMSMLDRQDRINDKVDSAISSMDRMADQVNKAIEIIEELRSKEYRVYSKDRKKVSVKQEHENDAI